MIDFMLITDKLLTRTIAENDLNDALFMFQNAVGIDSGDVAGLVFSGRGWDTEWPLASPDRRIEMMNHYIDVERIYST